MTPRPEVLAPTIDDPNVQGAWRHLKRNEARTEAFLSVYLASSPAQQAAMQAELEFHYTNHDATLVALYDALRDYTPRDVKPAA
jgi:hypothetical protein